MPAGVPTVMREEASHGYHPRRGRRYDNGEDRSPSSDLEATGSVSPDPLGAGSVSPDPKDMVSVSPRVMGSAPPDLKDEGSVSSDGDPYRRQPL